MLRTFSVLVALTCASLPAKSQTPEFENLPVWPSDGKLPKSLQDTYVFRDLATMEIVISYPNDPSDPAGKRTVYRYRPQNQVDARVSILISLLSDGRMQYSYSVANGQGAKESITIWCIVVPDSATDLEVMHPRWLKLHVKNSTLKQAAFPSLAPGHPVDFFSQAGPGLAISPGQETGGFRITSTYTPGFTTAYARGGKPLSTNGDLPLAVGNQLIPLMRWEQTNQIIPTLGPRYPPATPKQTIAEEYLSGLNLMLKYGQVMPESPFVSALSRTLDSCRDLSANGCRAADVNSAATLARSPVERQIAMAVAIALGSRAMQ